MTPRRFLFWIHLTAGSVAGLVILIMSVTGVLLAYKRQVINWADHGFQSQLGPGAQRLPLDELLAKVQGEQGRMPSAISVRSGPAAPVAFDFGRERTLFVDPYTGVIMSYGWANSLLYRMTGNVPPPQGPVAVQSRPARDSGQISPAMNRPGLKIEKNIRHWQPLKHLI